MRMTSMREETNGLHGTIQSALYYNDCQCVDGEDHHLQVTGGYLLYVLKGTPDLTSGPLSLPDQGPY